MQSTTLSPAGIEVGVTVATTAAILGCTSTFIVVVGPDVIETVILAVHGEPATQGEGEGGLGLPLLQTRPALSHAPPQTMPLELIPATAPLLEL
jgi:hypothetical protein